MKKCHVCGHEKFFTVHSYNEPDRYEKLAGIQEVNRCWVRCMKCGFYLQIRNYDFADLKKIYTNGYRDRHLRGESISEAYERIINIKNSENQDRFIWFATNAKYADSTSVLDIGSGLGVWPAVLRDAGYDVNCVEINEASVDFIYEKLGLMCFENLDSVYGAYDVVSMIHILEHIEHPKMFLKEAGFRIKKGGYLFVEVPDASEFSYLEKNHEEFNSCHLAFYNMANLHRTIESADLTVVDMRLVKTKDRKLSRIMCLATN